MTALAQWAVGLAVAVLIALLAYLVRGLISWGKFDTTLHELVKKTEQNSTDIKDVRERMLTKEMVENMILRVQVDTLKGVVKGAQTGGGA